MSIKSLIKVRKFKQDFEDINKKFMKCESAYLEQRDKDNLFGSRNGIEVKIHSLILIKTSKI